MNNRMLKSEMVLYGDTIETLATCLGIVRQTLSRKMSGEYDFTQTEMSLIKERYNLSDEKFVKIFAKDVSEV